MAAPGGPEAAGPGPCIHTLGIRALDRVPIVPRLYGLYTGPPTGPHERHIRADGRRPDRKGPRA